MPKLLLTSLLLALIAAVTGCGTEAPPMGNAVHNRDSLPVMVNYGVSKLISDSGVIRYKFITEEWRVYDKTTPPRWEFPQGIFLERFDDNFKPNMHVIADSAILYDQKLLRLRGHIYLKDDAAHTIVRTNELYWNLRTGDLSSNVHTRLQQPEQEIEGDWFRARLVGRRLTQYHIKQSKGFMPMNSSEEETARPATDTDTMAHDTLPPRDAPQPRRR